MDRDYRIVDRVSHYDLYINGKFYCSTYSFAEAVREAEHYFNKEDQSEITSDGSGIDRR